jgi:hypothetical protein
MAGRTKALAIAVLSAAAPVAADTGDGPSKETPGWHLATETDPAAYLSFGFGGYGYSPRVRIQAPASRQPSSVQNSYPS